MEVHGQRRYHGFYLSGSFGSDANSNQFQWNLFISATFNHSPRIRSSGLFPDHNGFHSPWTASSVSPPRRLGYISMHRFVNGSLQRGALMASAWSPYYSSTPRTRPPYRISLTVAWATQRRRNVQHGVRCPNCAPVEVFCLF